MSNYYYLIGLVFILWSCKENSDLPDVSHIDIETQIIRFDSLLYHVKTPDDIKTIFTAYPAYSDLYFHRILRLPKSDSLFSRVHDMLQAETFRQLDRKINYVYKDFASHKNSWKQAMKYYTYYFEPDEVPDLYTTVTEFAYGSFIFPITDSKDGIGLSLDLFLGDSVNYSAMARMDPAFSTYNSRTFNSDHLIKKAIDALIDDLLPRHTNPQFLYPLIREGKKHFIAKKILPFISDTVLWEYTPAEWQYVQDNEWNIYSFLITQELFYSTQRSKYSRLIQPAPNSIDMAPGTPGRAAIYCGYNIVKRYMERFPETSLADLVDLDAQLLFQEAKYKPKR